MISARIALFASATTAAARPIMPCTNPGEGFALVRASITWCETATPRAVATAPTLQVHDDADRTAISSMTRRGRTIDLNAY